MPVVESKTYVCDDEDCGGSIPVDEVMVYRATLLRHRYPDGSIIRSLSKKLVYHPECVPGNMPMPQGRRVLVIKSWRRERS